VRDGLGSFIKARTVEATRSLLVMTRRAEPATVQFSDEEDDADATDEVRAPRASLGGAPPPAAPARAEREVSA